MYLGSLIESSLLIKELITRSFPSVFPSVLAWHCGPLFKGVLKELKESLMGMCLFFSTHSISSSAALTVKCSALWVGENECFL